VIWTYPWAIRVGRRLEAFAKKWWLTLKGREEFVEATNLWRGGMGGGGAGG
jgi:hypothetical protein